ncbi:MAG: hypothetical protein RL136_796 [Planctomycetota bacterium]
MKTPAPRGAANAGVRRGFGPSAPLAACALASVTSLTSSAPADLPDLGGAMVHLIVDFDGVNMQVYPESTGPLTLQRYEGADYAGAAAILNTKAYNAQFGWLVGGFWQPPLGNAVWIERMDSTPGLQVYDQGTFEPIHGTDGSPSAAMWNGVMRHNWYAVDSGGSYSAHYRVYLGDPFTAEPNPKYGQAEVVLQWEFDGPASCPADLDGNGTIDAADLAMLLGAWNSGGSPADLDGSGTVDAADLATLLGSWGPC